MGKYRVRHTAPKEFSIDRLAQFAGLTDPSWVGIGTTSSLDAAMSWVKELIEQDDFIPYVMWESE
jgi:hypothetical protein